jgi:transposase-like protein
MSLFEPPVRRAKNAHYPLSFRQEALRLVAAGTAPSQVTAQLGLGPSTLQKWLRYARLAPTLPMRTPLFSPVQKHQIAREVRAGHLTEDETLRKYGLRLKRTLRRWVAEQIATEAADGPPSPPVTTSPTPAQAADLAAQVQQAQWQLEALHTLIDQAEATYHIAIRKKVGAKPSK